MLAGSWREEAIGEMQFFCRSSNGLIAFCSSVSTHYDSCPPDASLSLPIHGLPQPPRSSLLYQVATRLREFATIRAMEAAHNAIRTATGATANGAAALALRSGESGKPCKLRMRSAQARLPPSHAARSSEPSSACSSTAVCLPTVTVSLCSP